jgi:pimeloyl-ACP methyl ester carboxylesterase
LALPLVLLHGLGTGPSGWLPQREAFPDAIALRLDEAEMTMDGLEAPFDLCGLSLGALVALRYAGERPERVRRLVVCAGFVRLPFHLRMLQLAMAGLMRAVPRRVVLNGLASAVPEPHREAARAELDGIDAPGLMRSGASFRLERLLPMPALVLCGERDRINLRLSRRLAAALRDARFELVPDAAHVANLDNPEAFNRLLRDFLAD